MLRFETRNYKASALIDEPAVPALSLLKGQTEAKSAEPDLNGLFIDYGKRESSYPYTQQNLYTEEKERPIRVAVLENDKMYAEFLIDFGGRLWKLFDKVKKRDVVYTNDVIRLRNLSTRNAWFSGGIEWNCGIMGHSPFTCSPMYCAEVVGKNGEEILRFYEYERVRGIYYQMDFWFEDTCLMTAIHIENPNDEVVPMYWWATMASPEFQGGRVVVPADSAYSSSDGKMKSSIPFDNGVDVSYSENIADMAQYFYDIDNNSNKFIANVNRDGYGLLEFSSNNIPGRKLFSWGHRPGSYHWQKMLTDKAGDYVEIQSGITKTQFECMPMMPKASWDFLECFTLADIGTEAAQSDYKTLVNAVNSQIETVSSSKMLDERIEKVRDDISLQKGRMIYKGSGFGFFSGLLSDDTPKQLEFLENDDVSPWISLIKNDTIGENCVSFAFGDKMEKLLLESPKNDEWQIPYQLALIAYDKREFSKTEKYCAESVKIQNNYFNNHLYAHTLYQLNDKRYVDYAMKCIEQNPSLYSLCESVMRLFIADEKYGEIIKIYNRISDELKSSPRLNMYLSMAYLKLGDADEAERILLSDGGLDIFDYREGDRFLDELYRGIRKIKYGEDGAEVKVPEKFDFIVL